MLSFDVSAIDIVLLIAEIALLLIFVTQRKGHVETESQLLPEKKDREPETQKTKGEVNEESFSGSQSSIGFTKCVHHFGFLRNLPQNTPVPDECFGCPTIMRCLFPNEQ